MSDPSQSDGRRGLGSKTSLVQLGLSALVLAVLSAPVPTRAADAVTEWTLEADKLGGGGANWHTLAIMHQAMHDAANAANPVYERWTPRASKLDFARLMTL